MNDLPMHNAVVADYVRRNASLAFLVLEPDGTIREANDHIRRLTGKPCVGAKFRDILVDFTADFDLGAALIAPEPVLVNLDTRQGLPQTIYFRFLQHGRSIFAFGEVNAIEVDQLRKGLLDMNCELSNLSRQLHKQNADLIRLNELKNHFLGMAAHDLRNPLGAIRTYTGFLLEEAGEGLQSDHVAMLNDIRYLSDFMLGMITDLLDISVIESGKMRMHLRRGDLGELVRHSMVLNRAFAEKKGILLELTQAPVIPDFHFDSAKIKQVLNNLISNAIKFSHGGTTVRLDISATESHALVTVRDQGQGIPAHEMELLFRPFARFSVKSTAEEPSTGLGLAICQKIVLAHRGNIWAESTVGAGSAFSFSLPLDLATQEDA